MNLLQVSIVVLVSQSAGLVTKPSQPNNGFLDKHIRLELVQTEKSAKTVAILKKIEAKVKAQGAQLVKQTKAVFQLNIGDQHFHLDLKNGNGAVKWGVGAADAIIQMADPDFVALAEGRLNAVGAFMAGKLKVKGNMMLAQKLGPIMKSVMPHAKAFLQVGKSGAQSWLQRLVGEKSILQRVEAAVKSRGAELVKMAPAVFQLNVGDEKLNLDLRKGNGLAKWGEDKADVTITIAEDDLTAIARGELDGMQALMSGKLNVKGDALLAQSLVPIVKSVIAEEQAADQAGDQAEDQAGVLAGDQVEDQEDEAALAGEQAEDQAVEKESDEVLAGDQAEDQAEEAGVLAGDQAEDKAEDQAGVLAGDQAEDLAEDKAGDQAEDQAEDKDGVLAEDKAEDQVEDKAEDQVQDKASALAEAEDLAEDKAGDQAEDQALDDQAKDQAGALAEAEDLAEDKAGDLAEDQAEDKDGVLAEDKAEDQVEDKAEDQVEDKVEDQVEDTAEGQAGDQAEADSEADELAEDKAGDQAEDQA